MHRLLDIDPTLRTAQCAICGPVRVRRQGNGWRCNPGRTDRDRGTNRRARLRLEQAQGGLCAICGDDGPLEYDHNHVTGEPRGALCHGCNSGLGFFRDDPKRLRAAIRYLESR
jgi:hypothetical protein